MGLKEDVLRKWNCTQEKGRSSPNIPWQTRTKCFCADGRFVVWSSRESNVIDYAEMDKRMSYLCKGSIPGGVAITKPLIDVTRTGLTKPGPSDVGYISSYQRDLQAKAAAAGAAAQCVKAKPTIIPRYFTAHNITPTPGNGWYCRDGVWIWTMDAAEKVQVNKALAESDAAPYTPTPPYQPPTTPPTTPPTRKCSRGNRYTPAGFEKCDAGYHETWEGWFPTRRRYCDCDFASSEEGDGFFGVDIDKITGLAPLVIGGAIVVALLGLFKK